MMLRPARSTLFPYTTLFRSGVAVAARAPQGGDARRQRRLALGQRRPQVGTLAGEQAGEQAAVGGQSRSEEHTSELQSRLHLVCRLLLEKKKSPSFTSPCCDG